MHDINACFKCDSKMKVLITLKAHLSKIQRCIIWLKVAFNNSPNLPTPERAAINYSTHLPEARMVSPRCKDSNNDRNYFRPDVKKLRPAVDIK